MIYKYAKELLKLLSESSIYKKSSKTYYVELDNFLKIVVHDGAYIKYQKDVRSLEFLHKHDYVILCNVGCIVTKKGKWSHLE
ncbi:hypothetical protein OAQ12_03175 [Candidatus Marinimicrobia bacterium]|nr:hypothetical protein [Candidatus Neomarinimicrobiota bacterium]